MKYAIILAHPKPYSICASIASAYAAAAHSLGHRVAVRDLYAMDFDPRLRADELPTEVGYQMAADAIAERAHVADAAVFVSSIRSGSTLRRPSSKAMPTGY